MNKLQKLLLLAALVPMLVLTACKDDDPLPASDDFNTLKTYMVANNLDLPNVLDGWITGAPAEAAEVDAWADGFYIIDIRGASDYSAGHIKGAVNTTLGNILNTAASSGGKPILVVCYTGQTAGHAVVALRLSGYPDAKVLKWGMSGWSSTTAGPWENNIGSSAVGTSGWMKPMDIAQNQDFDYPSFNAQNSNGEAMLAERVQFMLNQGFRGVSNADVLANPEGYF
ncbi:MAG: rhodanese-like domain-containing protein, partial [Cyclobacteriaceae bacterium]